MTLPSRVIKSSTTLRENRERHTVIPKVVPSYGKVIVRLRNLSPVSAKTASSSGRPSRNSNTMRATLFTPPPKLKTCRSVMAEPHLAGDIKINSPAMLA